MKVNQDVTFAKLRDRCFFIKLEAFKSIFSLNCPLLRRCGGHFERDKILLMGIFPDDSKKENHNANRKDATLPKKKYHQRGR